jgi:hypothetical protein
MMDSEENQLISSSGVSGITFRTPFPNTDDPNVGEHADEIDLIEFSPVKVGVQETRQGKGCTGGRPLSQGQRKRKNVDNFQEWVRNHEINIAEASKRSSNPGDLMTLSKLISDGTQKGIIKSPREYQSELFERAKQENTIVVLPTGKCCKWIHSGYTLIGFFVGSGKTLIATMLLKYHMEKEIVDRATGKSKKVAFFVVRSTLHLSKMTLKY